MAETKQPFKLSAVLAGHAQDVKAIKFSSHDGLCSSSRDSTARLWKLEPTGDRTTWHEKMVYQNASPGFLNAVERVTIDREEYIITAGQDALVQLWPVSPNPNEAYEPRFILAGHSANVCCLNVLRNLDQSGGGSPIMVSGSWDCSAIVWRNNQALYTLLGHSAAVWAVMALDEHQFLTGGADNLIYLWNQNKQVKTFKGHSQAVRALTRLSPDRGRTFASAGNDATIRLWDLDNGQSLKVLSATDAFIYSIDYLPSGELLSSGEDRAVRLWDLHTGSVTQTITVPAISVWTVSACQENGDFACGSSDNLIRIFTRSSERFASQDDLLRFEDSVKTSSVPSATVGDLKKTDLPTVQVLLCRRGRKDGETAMAKNEATGSIEAFQWDSIKGDWNLVGTVVDGDASCQRHSFEGKEYDYVFDVDIKDGVPPIKLPYNVSENPYLVAQKWLAKHQLPASYQDQIVDFIDKNTSGVSIGTPAAGADPFAGSGGYYQG